MTVILGLESSCDDTSAALVTSDRRVLAQAIVGQTQAHQPYGGVVPEIAARAHVEILPGLIEKVLGDAGMSVADVDAVAATAGPGLIGGVMVALLAGKGLALAAGKPLIAVNHLEGHALSPRLVDAGLDFPYVLLLVSGGHCQLLEVRGVGEYRRLATTIDDAVGEAFDKAAKLLGLPYPGGPAVQAPFRCPARSSVRASRISPSPGSRARFSAPSPRASFRTRTSPRASSRRSSTASSTVRVWRSQAAKRLPLSSPGGLLPIRRSAPRWPNSRPSRAAASLSRPPGSAPTMRR
jgi:hypothetical protein